MFPRFVSRTRASWVGMSSKVVVGLWLVVVTVADAMPLPEVVAKWEAE